MMMAESAVQRAELEMSMYAVQSAGRDDRRAGDWKKRDPDLSRPSDDDEVDDDDDNDDLIIDDSLRR